MQILKSFFIAVSMYSNIPVPQFTWKKEDMKYIFCFLPWIGAIIAYCVYVWNNICDSWEIGIFCRTVVDLIIPIFLTGGFHVDGFMDTMDAFHSYQQKDRKLEILKDSHIGAFAVIMLALYGCIYLAAFSEIKKKVLLKIICCGFFLSRCLCGISAISFPLAKKEGTLSFFADSSKRNIVKLFLYLQSIACIGIMCFLSWYAIIVIIAALFSFVYYYYRSKKELGGVTGDTSGYFILLCEACMIIAASIVGKAGI